MITHKIRVYGIVQGVGFRPFVSRTCLENDIKGTVANKGSYVEIFAQGDVEPLMQGLKHNPPARSVILNVIDKEIDLPEFENFEIIESERDTGDIFVSPDIAICDECKAELFDKNNRRYMHPFINCTNCGPRLTILESMPYDRERTSMKEFEMCPECEYEYTHPETRRYDAQPVCCPNCGPVVYAFDPKKHTFSDIEKSLSSYNRSVDQILESNKNTDHSLESNKDSAQTLDRNIIVGNTAITAARQAICEGRIVAIKGIGGFHLCCDATNEDAVTRLRTLKNRPMKPFAVMMKDLETVRKECRLPEGESYFTELLNGHEKPIVLLDKREETRVAESVSPDNLSIGVMLPYTPIHLLLFDYEDELNVSEALVMTSANASGAPICRTDEDAIKEISGFTDLVLSNNRTIRTRADDTVMDILDGKPYMIRRSRGYAPLPIMVSSESLLTRMDDAKHFQSIIDDDNHIPSKTIDDTIAVDIHRSTDKEACIKSVLGIGGELKNTFCIAKNSLLYPSAYVGDMADIRTVQALEESVDRMQTLLEAKPEIVVADLHPKYNTTSVAEDYAERNDVPLLQIQHHYAHILSCMAENDYLDEVIGVSFDGTGYGTDGTIWGGEYLRCSLEGFERLGHIAPFIQCGGDLSSKEGWRIAASILGDFAGLNQTDYSDMVGRLDLCSENEYKMLSNMARTGINSVLSTSAGRLFDAVSAILGIRRSSTFEGEAATALMYAAQRFLRRFGYGDMLAHIVTNYIIRDSYKDTNHLVREIAAAYLEGADPDELAMVFHMKLAEMISDEAMRYSEMTGIKTIALSGGVFQNKLLVLFVSERLKKSGLRVLLHSLVPPNDGGIAVGQALYGLAHV
ncbi:hydrogenase maturation protein HypF [Lachnospiraceae bacterium NE2001]|nr:hydrogenase maturation protein HypF [Lachnospiraceae bacterium NE2001]